MCLPSSRVCSSKADCWSTDGRILACHYFRVHFQVNAVIWKRAKKHFFSVLPLCQLSLASELKVFSAVTHIPYLVQV